MTYLFYLFHLTCSAATPELPPTILRVYLTFYPFGLRRPGDDLTAAITDGRLFVTPVNVNY